MSLKYNQFLCPLCGKTNHISQYDPSEYVEDVIGIQLKGLGRGRGFSIAYEGSLLESDNPVVDLIANRVKVLHTMFYEGDSVEELLDEINEALDTGYDNLLDAAVDLLSRLEDYREEELDEADIGASASHEVNEEDEPLVVLAPEEAPLSELDYEIRRGEQEEES